MLCPYCSHMKDRVVDSRESKEGLVVRRRRECLSCGRRYTTYERIGDIPCMVIKKGGRRENFSRGKVLQGLTRASEKRPVSARQLEEIADEVEALILESPERELTSEEIGGHVMKRLKELDKVAYVRFASVYREFKDVKEFMEEIKHLFQAPE